MFATNEITSKYMAKHIPEQFRAMKYRKVAIGEELRITKIAYSTYEAKNPEGEPILYKDGSPVLKTTAYIGFSDGSYTTSHGDTVVGQLVSETGAYPEEIGVENHEVDCPVRIISHKVTYGRGASAKSYDTWAFEPM